MNLAELIDYIGNLVDYDPLNSAYRAQLTSLINEAQVRTLSDGRGPSPNANARFKSGPTPRSPLV